jgi:tRNA(Ile)-lysidine synthase
VINVINRVAAALERFEIPPEKWRIGVAVSGGADSVFLLMALHELGVASAVLHVNHQLRGAESDGDEASVRQLAERLGLPFRLYSAQLDAGNTEQEARRARYDFFAHEISAGTCDLVATGHTLDDQAETVLYRFLKGSGTAGLAGIRPITDTGFIRPLLEINRSAIRFWLTERNLTWREDSSNENSDFARNRIRSQHMPELAASLNPALPEILASTARWARDEEDYWHGELDRLEKRFFIARPETILMKTKDVLSLPVAVQRRLVRRGIERVRGSLRSIDFRHVEGIRVLMAQWEGSGRIQLPGLDVYRSFDWLRLSPVGFDGRVDRDFETPLISPGVTLDIARRLAIEVELAGKSDVYNDGVDGLDWDRCAGSLLLRNWRPGDQYQSRGRNSAEKIKTLFQEYRIPLWERRAWPVIAQGNSIVWSRRFGVASEFAAGPDTRNVLVIRELDSEMESNRLKPASMELKRASDSTAGQSGAEVL